MSAGISLITLTELERAADAEALAVMLSRFSCPLNSDIEDYLKNSKRARSSSLPEERRASGEELLRLALGLFRGTKKVLGGKLVMVERESDRPKLQAFYSKNGFKSWTRRINEKDGILLASVFNAQGIQNATEAVRQLGRGFAAGGIWKLGGDFFGMAVREGVNWVPLLSVLRRARCARPPKTARTVE